MTLPRARYSDNDAPFLASPQGGWLAGPWRRPTNSSSHETGSIHDDTTAQALGFRRGTVAGSIHMEQFTPLLLHALGADWQRTGGLSLWFMQPTADGEPVQAQVRDGPAARRDLRMLAADGGLVLQGSASSSDDMHGSLRQRLAGMRPGAPPRMLASLAGGICAAGLPTRVAQADVAQRLALITEARATFTQPAGRVGCEVPLSAAVHAMRVFEAQLPVNQNGFVGLFGGIEWQWLDGPMFTERPYQVSGRVVAVTDSPRSEMLWTQTTLRDPATGRDVARMLMLSRLLKQSSALWASETLHP